MKLKYFLLTFVLLFSCFLFSNKVKADTCQANQIPGGGKITFASNRDGDDEIYTMDGNECNLIKLTDNTYQDFSPSISPDGKKIAFVSDRDSRNSEIFVMNIDGTNQKQLTFTDNPNHPGSPWHNEPAWSPDGTKIVYVEGPYASNAQVRVMNADGSNQHLLVNSPSDSVRPKWVNNNQIVFSSRTCSGCPYHFTTDVINTDGSGRYTLIDSGHRDIFANFSPDGSSIAFSSDRDNTQYFEIYSANADGTNQSRLTYGGGSDYHPFWTPDGSKIMFDSDMTGNPQIYIMDKDGENLIRLTNNNYSDSTPVWGGISINNPPTVGQISATGEHVITGLKLAANASFDDPDSADTHTAVWDWGDGSTSAGTVDETGKSVTGDHVYTNPGVYTIILSVTDNHDATGKSPEYQYTYTNSTPEVGQINAIGEPVATGTNLAVNALFTDADLQDSHTALWDWGDGSTSVGTVDEPGKNVTGNHIYTEAGVHAINLSVTDNHGATGNAPPYQYVVVYNLEGGFVTGGGWINSPAGAYVPDTELAGKANFGFVSKYQKGANTPDGSTEFQFKVANFNFHSNSYDWLVVAGSNAKFKGTGTVNGSGNYGFMLTATDGDLNGGTGTDGFRIKIWDKDNNGQIVYDNKMGDSDDGYSVTDISGGNIIIHK